MAFNHNIDQIGVGALFPIHLSTNEEGNKGWYPTEGDPTLIENNLIALIEYSIGQRFRQEDFGTRLWECIEEKNTQAIQFLVREFLLEAIRKYEQRIKVKQVITERESTKLHIIMEFVIVGINRESYMSINYDLSTNNLS